ncbi:hypothetical protein J671_3400 [Acinetobacter sp. 1130196]|nr:hypothetical protein J514_2762 [Acinetobacter sp. 1396970]EXE50571.1 hypothetical protein J576_1734 [Acinetobacter sp. 766875]EXE98513.1 hypothetical protein J594_2477 [Acinetobacter sp. 259052]EXH16831.1 hypothetical protein J627_0130 [Acinetobacter sp. 1245593]EXH76900.1 hypothetical protein J633_1704 [Acinetobacter sp. 216872]EXR10019.1 hypothetical protein J671_3400 [Acinetobacter sp. 1130196]EXR30329.1 hypothetical protein J694_1111 [Acinetobacter sp. 1281984]EXS43504.1 hypothetical 
MKILEVNAIALQTKSCEEFLSVFFIFHKKSPEGLFSNF